MFDQPERHRLPHTGRLCVRTYNGREGERTMTEAQGTACTEDQIRALIDVRVVAVQARDVDGALATIAPDIHSFDVVNPLHYGGAPK